MRVISGKNKGRKIKMPKGIRPTSNKVRKAIFDILGDIEGLSFLELFAGSGAVGLEALSYGAKKAVFVERDRDCMQIIRANLSAEPRSNYNLYEEDVFKAIKELCARGLKFDLVFLDPPYYKKQLHSASKETTVAKSLAKKTLKMLLAYDILTPLAFIIVQHYKRDTVPQELGKLSLFKRSVYADTVLSFYKIKG